MIGNSEADVQAGHAVGCQSIQVSEDLDLVAAAEIIAKYESEHGS